MILSQLSRLCTSETSLSQSWSLSFNGPRLIYQYYFTLIYPPFLKLCKLLASMTFCGKAVHGSTTHGEKIWFYLLWICIFSSPLRPFLSLLSEKRQTTHLCSIFILLTDIYHMFPGSTISNIFLLYKYFHLFSHLSGPLELPQLLICFIRDSEVRAAHDMFKMQVHSCVITFSILFSMPLLGFLTFRFLFDCRALLSQLFTDDL